MKHATFILVIGLSLFGSMALSARERHDAPGNLGILMWSSAVIAETSFEAEKDGVLRFRIVRTIKGRTKKKTVLVTTLGIRTQRYVIMHGAERVLMFLYVKKDGELGLTNGYIRAEGDDANIVKDVERYMILSSNLSKGKTEVQAKAFRSFVLKKVASSKSEYFRRNMAAEIWGRVNHMKVSGFEGKGDAIANAVLAESLFSVAEPLCLVLDKFGSERTNASIVHTLLNTQDSETSRRLSVVISKRAKLVQELWPKLDKMTGLQEQSGLVRAIGHLYLVPDTQLLANLRRLWQENPKARPMIKSVLSGRRSKPAIALLRELREETEKESERGKKGGNKGQR